MGQFYAMCPVCGRSVIAGDEVGAQKSLFHEDLETNATKRGGTVWEMVARGLGRGRGFENVQSDAPESLIERVQRIMAERCRRFLEWYEGEQ